MNRTTLAVGALLVVGLGAACGSKSTLEPDASAGSGGHTGGAAGQSGASGAPMDASGVAGTTGAAGAAGASGSTGTAGSGGTPAPSDASVDVAPNADGGDAALADATVVADGGVDTDGSADGSLAELLKVRPTPGCGHAAVLQIGTPVKGTIQTMGTKDPICADTNCAPWSYLREFYLTLPVGYDKTKAYPLVFEPSDASGTGLNVYDLGDLVGNTVIRVGLTPPPNAIGHATNPNQGDFDDHEGNDSIEWAFYENLYDELAADFCFDKNRVFVAGSGRGATLVNDFGCKYAGDATRPVRGILSNAGGLLPPVWLPACTDKPMAGVWIHGVGDQRIPFTQATAAIARAMKVNGCTIGTGYSDAEFDVFPVGGSVPDGTCKKIRGCPDATPLVVCPLLTNQSSFEPEIANPTFSTYLKLFETAPLLTP